MARPVPCGVSLLRAALLSTAALSLLAAPAALARVGVTSATDGDPLGKPPTQPERVLRIGIDVQANEAITTGSNDRAHLVFLDGTSLTVGPNARVIIDKFVFDPATKTGELAVNASKGVFRLVGGKISKTQPITITTPSSTIGIRGGITVFAVEQTATSSTFVFGDKMTVTGQGQTQTATRPGSQIVTNFGSQPGQPSLIAQGALAGLLGQLEGKSGSNTQGTNNIPAGSGSGAGQNSIKTAEQGAQNFSQQNNGQPPTQNPILLNQTAVAFNQQLNNALSTAISTATSNSPQQQVQQALQDRNSQPNNNPQPDPPANTQVIVTLGRFIGATPYTNFNYSENGLVVTPVASANKPLQPTGVVTDRNRVEITTGDGHSIVVPWHPTGSPFPIAPIVDQQLGVLVGTGYVSPDGKFFAYVFNNGANQKVGFFGGEPTTLRSHLPTSGIVAYDVTNLAGSTRLPFANGTVGDDPNLQAVKDVSKLLAVFAPQTLALNQPAGNQKSAAMQASIAISGTGAAQKSYMGVMVGYYFPDLSTVSVGFGGNYVGTYRLDSHSGPNLLVSAISTPSTGASNAIYGDNADYMVMTPDKLATTYTTRGGVVNSISTTRTSQASADVGLQNSTANDYFGVNAAGRTSTPESVGQSRTTRTLTGFIAGLIDQRRDTGDGSIFNTKAFGTGSSRPNLTLTTDASTNQATATIRRVALGAGNSDRATIRLGNPDTGGQSAFIDDNTYAMTGGNVTVRRGGGISPTASTALVSANTNPTALNGLYNAAEVTPCTCAFLSWGFWGGDIRYGAHGSNVTDRINLATYVAGTLTSAVQMPNTGTATYVGDMVGNVRNGGASYVAVGGYTNQWNFATRTGAVSISNFDGTSYRGGTAMVGNTPQFTGGFAATNSTGRVGTLNGAFFNNGAVPAAGQAGSFGVTGPNYTAAGTFKAQR
ncbi:FecR family protein [Enhydrobacter aerosaccus]|uniref:FecR family protein n=1 Tax=Enhydrobacter aerosaccus TaxID=225324 RepID=A0A1T4JJX1_9HYPH|nr:FecR domain-containing protein [Enhydrobacter aerosaccus]SJZ30428.1 FecR family protein [Enhydrobacter aerosaccus]